jgi:hypothetical protein
VPSRLRGRSVDYGAMLTRSTTLRPVLAAGSTVAGWRETMNATVHPLSINRIATDRVTLRVRVATALD